MKTWSHTIRVLERVWRRCVALYLELPALDVEEGTAGTSKKNGEPRRYLCITSRDVCM